MKKAAVQTVLAFAVPEDSSVADIMKRVGACELLTITDISRAMRVSPGLVNGWIDEKFLPAIKIGIGKKRQHYRVSRATFERFLHLRQTGVAQ